MSFLGKIFGDNLNAINFYQKLFLVSLSCVAFSASFFMLAATCIMLGLYFRPADKTTTPATTEQADQSKSTKNELID